MYSIDAAASGLNFTSRLAVGLALTLEAIKRAELDAAGVGAIEAGLKRGTFSVDMLDPHYLLRPSVDDEEPLDGARAVRTRRASLGALVDALRHAALHGALVDVVAPMEFLDTESGAAFDERAIIASMWQTIDAWPARPLLMAILAERHRRQPVESELPSL